MLASSDKGSLRGYARRRGSGRGKLIGRDSPGSGEQTDPQECRASDRTPPRGSGVPISDTCFSQTKDKAKGERKEANHGNRATVTSGFRHRNRQHNNRKGQLEQAERRPANQRGARMEGKGGARRQTITNILHTEARRCLHLCPIT